MKDFITVLSVLAFIIISCDSGKNENSLLAITEFITSKSQELEEFEESVNNLSMNQIKITRDSDKADSIRELDTKLENLDKEIKKTELWKPKSCDCNCIQNNFLPLNTAARDSSR